VRDVLIYRDAEFVERNANGTADRKRGLPAGSGLREFPNGATIATSSTRRQAQLLAARPDLKLVPIRGNVGTRLQKLADQAALDGIVLAAAGLERLGFQVAEDGRLLPGAGGSVPEGLRAAFFPVEEMIPCVGQAAIGIEARASDGKLKPVLDHLNHAGTAACVRAERAFLRAMGGGCLSPDAAYARIEDGRIRLQAISFRGAQVQRTERVGSMEEAEALGIAAAADVKD
jgi:hydroxymethylbilane synthase